MAPVKVFYNSLYSYINFQLNLPYIKHVKEYNWWKPDGRKQSPIHVLFITLLWPEIPQFLDPSWTQQSGYFSYKPGMENWMGPSYHCKLLPEGTNSLYLQATSLCGLAASANWPKGICQRIFLMDTPWDKYRFIHIGMHHSYLIICFL